MRIRKRNSETERPAHEITEQSRESWVRRMDLKRVTWDYENPLEDELWRARRLAEFLRPYRLFLRSTLESSPYCKVNVVIPRSLNNLDPRCDVQEEFAGPDGENFRVSCKTLHFAKCILHLHIVLFSTQDDADGGVVIGCALFVVQ
jgi:hypothetical protein